MAEAFNGKRRQLNARRRRKANEKLIRLMISKWTDVIVERWELLSEEIST
jgi:hypothetical protein